MSKFYDVIIGGAGPVGLFLACELGLAGVSVLVLERDAKVDPLWTAKPIGMRGLNTLSIESLYRRGLMEKIIEPIDERTFDIVKKTSPQFAGHFAGMMVDANKFNLSRWKYRLPGPSLLPARTDLDRIGIALSERAESLGVTILKGSAVKTLSQDIDGVTVYAGEQEFRSKYLVGCDGGRSTIRKEGGFEFIGTEPQFTGYTALCELDDHTKLQPGFQPTPSGMYIHLASTGLIDDFGHVIVMDFDGGKFDRTKTVTREHFQDILRRISGTDVTVKELRFVTTFTDRALQAKTYRKDRVLLAGDSAHIHSPLGGQGLNAGLGDAMNLGWKLALVVKETAPESLLDTYCEEREPIGAWVVEWTRAQVTVLKPDLFGVATAKIMRDLIDTTDGANYFIDRVWGLWQRYDLGDEHSLVGASAPDFEFVDGNRLGTEMRDGKGLLIDFSNNSSLADLAAGLEEKLEYVNTQVKENLGLDALLLRPDGIVAWVAEGQPDLKTAKAALLRWFGSIDQASFGHRENSPGSLCCD